MLEIQAIVPALLTDDVLAVLGASEAVGTITVQRGAGIQPEGDVVAAQVAREGADAVIHALFGLHVQVDGSITVQPIQTWASQRNFQATKDAAGAGSDAVVWLDVVQRAYDDSELNWTFLAFMTFATLIAGVALILDSPILLVGAMVLGPEFGPVAALGVALLRRRWTLLLFALRSLLIGFLVAMTATALVTLVGRWLGWVTEESLTTHRTMTAFVSRPDQWSVVVAIIAAAAGVLSLTSSRTIGLAGVFVSVTTVPAAGNMALAATFGLWDELAGSAAQLGVNIVCMAVAGFATLAVQRRLWHRGLSWRWKRPGFRRLPEGAGGE